MRIALFRRGGARSRQKFGVAVIALGMLTACQPQFQSINGETMGTYYLVRYGSAACTLEQTDIEARLTALNQSMSTYIADSELMRINQGPAGSYPLSNDLAHVISAAIDLHGQTGGTLDITIGPLVELWGFGAKNTGGLVPSIEEQQRVAAQVGVQHLELSDAGLFKANDDTTMDLSALAKGYAVDVLAGLADSAGCQDYMVDIGGEIRVAGTNPKGTVWRVGIEVPEPDGLGGTQEVLLLTNAAVATSGDYRNFISVAGERIDHILDPRSGLPATSAVVSSTVVHSQAMFADALATAFMVHEAQEAVRIADALGVAVYLVTRDSGNHLQTVYNAAMKQYLDQP